MQAASDQTGRLQVVASVSHQFPSLCVAPPGRACCSRDRGAEVGWTQSKVGGFLQAKAEVLDEGSDCRIRYRGLDVKALSEGGWGGLCSLSKVEGDREERLTTD